MWMKFLDGGKKINSLHARGELKGEAIGKKYHFALFGVV